MLQILFAMLAGLVALSRLAHLKISLFLSNAGGLRSRPTIIGPRLQLISPTQGDRGAGECPGPLPDPCRAMFLQLLACLHPHCSPRALLVRGGGVGPMLTQRSATSDLRLAS